MADAKISERAVAQQGQEKFQFYLLSLVFTLLALSIQTVEFGSFVIADYIELAGFLCYCPDLAVYGTWKQIQCYE